MKNNPGRKQIIEPIVKMLIFSVLLSYLIVVVYPLIWMNYTALKTDQEIFLEPFALPDLENLQWGKFRARLGRGALLAVFSQ